LGWIARSVGSADSAAWLATTSAWQQTLKGWHWIASLVILLAKVGIEVNNML